MTFAPSPNQQGYFNWVANGSGSAILEAVAGAGKTTTIMHGLPLMRGYVALMAYNSKMAKELKERVAAMERVDGLTVFAQTFHGAGLKALKFAFKNNRLDVNDKKVEKICLELIAAQGREDLRDLEGVVSDIVSMAKQRGIGALSPIDTMSDWLEMVDHFSLDDALPEGREHMVPQVVKMAQICLRRSNEDLDTIDFDDMVYLPLQRNIRMLTNDWVLVDEAQDTNPTRRALARKMLKPGGRLVAVGDPHQAIYGFTGTDNDSLEQIAEQFSCTRLPLTLTYRCPKAVVKLAHTWVGHIQAADTAPEGEVVRYGYDEILERAQPGDMILCRYNKYLISLVFKFIRAGISAKIEGRAIGAGLSKLAGRWKGIRTLVALESKLEAHLDREVAKARAKADERREEEARDRIETMHVLIERAREQKMETIVELQTMIMGLFDDAANVTKGQMLLCSVHRSKGLEARRVHILGLDEIMPARCSREWQLAQEYNLMYVAVTRSMGWLGIVHGIREERRPERAS